MNIGLRVEPPTTVSRATHALTTGNLSETTLEIKLWWGRLVYSPISAPPVTLRIASTIARVPNATPCNRMQPSVRISNGSKSQGLNDPANHSHPPVRVSHLQHPSVHMRSRAAQAQAPDRASRPRVRVRCPVPLEPVENDHATAAYLHAIRLGIQLCAKFQEK